MGEQRAARNWRDRKEGILIILLGLALLGAGAGLMADRPSANSGPVFALATGFDLPLPDYPEVPIEEHEPFVLQLPEFTPEPTPEPTEVPPPEPRAAAIVQERPAAAPPAARAQPTTAPAPPPPPAAPASPSTAAPASRLYIPQVSGGPLTTAERQLFDGLNAERARAGLGALAHDATLTRVGRTRVRQMIDQGYFAHVDPHGYTMYVELLRHFGASYRRAGENLARNNHTANRSAGEALSGLMRSPGHRANMLGASYRKVGIGHAVDGSGMHYFALIFTD